MSGKNLLLLITALLLTAVPIAGSFWYTAAQAPVNSAGEEQLVTIEPGTPTSAVGRTLFEARLIRSELAFLVAERLRGNFIQAGSYRLSPAMNLGDIIAILAEGEVAEHTVTIPEGWRAREIAALLTEKQIVSKEDFLPLAIPKEGYLFPDTYRFPLGVTAEEIVTTMRENFDTRTSEANLRLTRDDIILASIIEREADADDDRSKISAVYVNRLKIPMRLEADPTVQYAKTLVDSSLTDPWPKITTTDYREVNSPYNTYLNDGLPPGPIANPGLASLAAAKNPAAFDALYFFHTADGQTIYSRTLAEHNSKKSQHDLSI